MGQSGDADHFPRVSGAPAADGFVAGLGGMAVAIT